MCIPLKTRGVLGKTYVRQLRQAAETAKSLSNCAGVESPDRVMLLSLAGDMLQQAEYWEKESTSQDSPSLRQLVFNFKY